VDDAAKMYELQKVDVMLIKVSKRLQQLQQLLGETDAVRAARQQVAETEAALHSWRGKQKDAELEGKSLAERIQSTEQRLMSGTVRNPKELETLQQSLDALRRQRDLVEEHGVEAMLLADELTDTLTTRQAALQTVEGEWTGSQGELRQEDTKLKQNLMLLKRKREAVAATLGAPLLERYETMRKRKAGVAVAAVQNGSCSACHVSIPSGVMNSLRGSQTALVVCPSCGRYLVAAG